MLPLTLFFLFLSLETVKARIQIKLDGPSRAEVGSTITFRATVTGANDTDVLLITFFDTALQTQRNLTYYNVMSPTLITEESVEFPRDAVSPGVYTMQAMLRTSSLKTIMETEIAETTFELTEYLNGDIQLIQNNIKRPKNFVAVNEPVRHVVDIPDFEKQFINKSMLNVVTYWFKDCYFVDESDDFSVEFSYSDAMATSYVDALVVAISKEKSFVNNRYKRNAGLNVNEQEDSEQALNFKCSNAYVPISDGFICGHFHKRVSIREPVHAVNISEPDWINVRNNKLMNVLVQYAGSPPFEYCAQYKPGKHNMTGDETCTNKTKTARHSFPLIHIFSDNNPYTVVVIIENDIGKVVSTIGIQFTDELNIGSVLGLYYSNMTIIRRGW